MGFFSWKCPGCTKSILSPYSVDHRINSWMCSAVALLPNGSLIHVVYDGYGRIDGWTMPDLVAVWHRSCWVGAGRPEYSGPSANSDDQGFFFRTSDYADPDPELPPPPEAELEDLRATLRAEDDGSERGMAFRWKDQEADPGTWNYLKSHHGV